MSMIKLADITVHIDELLDPYHLAQMEAAVRGLGPVVSVRIPENRPHLMTVVYNPDHLSSREILSCVQAQEVHAELVGL